MTKITKTPISATIDTWIVNWIRQQDGKFSSIVNKILKDHIVARAEEPKKQKTLLSMTHREREAAAEAHLKRMYKELGWEDE